MNIKLKVTHVNFADFEGGAARAAYRIHQGLRKIGVDSSMAVLQKTTNDPHVLTPLGRSGKLKGMIRQRLASGLLSQQKTTNPVLHSLNFMPSGLAKWLNQSEADIINLHWLGGESISISEIATIQKPIVWTMHDMWPFSGAEHYDDLAHANRYKTIYCDSNRPSPYTGVDLDAWVHRLKKKKWHGKTIHLASPSKWLAECAVNSDLFKKQPIRVLPNGIDCNVYKPIDRKLARKILNLPQDKKLILFGAMSSTSDSRKGFHLLCPALKKLAQQPDFLNQTELMIFGASEPISVPDFGLPAHYLGRINDDTSLALLYSAADVFAAPSMQDNLPNTLVEALACGTPCVAFDIGGMPDLISHQSNGYLAKAFDIDDLASGIAWVLAQESDTMRNSSRRSAENQFDDGLVATRYVQYYKDILNNRYVSNT